MTRKKIAVIDYGMGNIGNVKKALENLGFPCFIAAKSSELEKASGAILPGVGSFGTAMSNLRRAKMSDAVVSFATSGRPFLGVCLGLQLLFSSSEESKGVKGLGIFDGKVVRFKAKDIKIPHIGWNQVVLKQKNVSILKGVGNNEYFYFVHSYYPVPQDKSIIATETEYGGKIFTSGVAKGNVFAFQFHPEKSQEEGLKIYRNFGKLCM